MKFILTSFGDNYKTTKEFEGDYLPDVLEEIELFLRGSGYVFDGELEIVDNNQEITDNNYNQENNNAIN